MRKLLLDPSLLLLVGVLLVEGREILRLRRILAARAETDAMNARFLTIVAGV